MTPTFLTTQKGSGDLVLKNGARQAVIWEIEIFSGSFGKGSIDGNREHLAAAAKDVDVNLHLGLEVIAAIAIDSCKDNRATFRTLSVFRMQRA